MQKVFKVKVVERFYMNKKFGKGINPEHYGSREYQGSV
jgi:hypothetical protein